MAALYPGGDTSYLDLYAELRELDLQYGKDFERRVSGPNAPYFVLSDEAYQKWLAKHGADSGATTDPDGTTTDGDGGPKTDQSPGSTGDTDSGDTGDGGDSGEDSGEQTGDTKQAHRRGKRGRSA